MFGAIAGGLLGGALSDRRASGGFGGVRGGFLGGSGYNPDVVRHGHRLDNRYFLQRHDAMYARAEARGLTPQEFYGSPAAGGSGPSGGAQTLGNMAASANASSKALMGQVLGAHEQAKTQKRGQDIQAKTQENVANIQKQSAENVAKIQAGAQRRGQDLTYDIGLRNFKLSEEQYYNVNLPQAQENIRKTQRETEKLINEVATSKPQFVKLMKIMTMSAPNSLNFAIQRMAGIDISDDDQLKRLSKEKRRKLIAALLAVNSNAAAELHGVNYSIDAWLDSMAESAQSIWDGVPSLLGDGIEKTTGKRSGPSHLPGR